MQKYEAAAEEQKRAYEKAMAEYRAAINPRPKLMCGDAMALTMAALFVFCFLFFLFFCFVLLCFVLLCFVFVHSSWCCWCRGGGGGGGGGGLLLVFGCWCCTSCAASCHWPLPTFRACLPTKSRVCVCVVCVCACVSCVHFHAAVVLCLQARECSAQGHCRGSRCVCVRGEGG